MQAHPHCQKPVWFRYMIISNEPRHNSHIILPQTPVVSVVNLLYKQDTWKFWYSDLQSLMTLEQDSNSSLWELKPKLPNAFKQAISLFPKLLILLNSLHQEFYRLPQLSHSWLDTLTRKSIAPLLIWKGYYPLWFLLTPSIRPWLTSSIKPHISDQ